AAGLRGRAGLLSLQSDVGAKLSEEAFADAAHHHQVFGAAETSVALALLDDARGQRRPDARQLLQLLARRAVDGDARRAVRRKGNVSTPRAGGRGAAGQFDASRVGRGGDAAQDDTAEASSEE